MVSQNSNKLPGSTNAKRPPLSLSPSVDLDQAGSEDGVLCNRVSGGEWAGALGDGGDGQAVHEELVEWEVSVEGDGVTLDGDTGDLFDDRQVLLVDVDER